MYILLQWLLKVINDFVFEYLIELNLDYIVDNPWMIIPCSALKSINVDEIIQWLIREADKPRK